MRDHRFLPREGEQGTQQSYDWPAHTHRSLCWQYGPERANEILAGRDPQTNADLSAWRSLGEPKGGEVA